METHIMAKWHNFTKGQLEEIIKQSRSIRQVKIALGYAPDSGSGSQSIKDMIKFYNFDISHFEGQSWNKNNYDYSRFTNNKKLKSDALPALIALKGHRCEQCLFTEWNGQPIPLQIHHIDADHWNSVLENLQLLCPNCHAQTDSFCGRNKNTGTKIYSDEEWLNVLQNSPSIRSALVRLGLNPNGGNYAKARELIYSHNIIHLINSGQKGE